MRIPLVGLNTKDHTIPTTVIETTLGKKNMNQAARLHDEIFFSLYKFIREGMEIPPSIRKHCGFADEYRMFEELKKMDQELY